uniref:Uncharacterized protein n=1 Tax=Acrobeloides nanus TaxID=290746 RepID=A0A914DI75_9BILA
MMREAEQRRDLELSLDNPLTFGSVYQPTVEMQEMPATTDPSISNRQTLTSSLGSVAMITILLVLCRVTEAGVKVNTFMATEESCSIDKNLTTVCVFDFVTIMSLQPHSQEISLILKDQRNHTE